MERVFVTGCGGFVGRVLVPRLKREGFEVWGLDRVRDDGSFQGEKYLVLDLSSGRKIEDLIKKAEPDFIVHLAAQSSAGISFRAPIQTLKDNVFGALHILEALRKNPKRIRLLAVGSAEEYGPVSPEELPLSEDREPKPSNPYALSKFMQSECCRLFSSLYNVDVVLARSFNHTGGGQTDTFVLPSFARQIAEIKYGLKKPVITTGDLEIKRDFLDVRDVAEAYILLLRKGKKGEIYNVCSGRSYKLSELLKEMCTLAGVDVEIKQDPSKMRRVDTRELRGDSRKITEDTGWSPEIPMKETLESLLEYWDGKVQPGGS